MISGKLKQFIVCGWRKLAGNRYSAVCLLTFALFTESCGSKSTENTSPLANTVSVPDGSVLQNPKDMRVYYVFDGKRHYIPNPPTLAALGFSQQVKVVTDSEINAIPLGGQMPLLTSNVMVKSGTGQVFMIEAGKRRYIPDPDTLAALHVTKEQIKYVPDAVADSIPLGTPLSHQSSKTSTMAVKH